MHVITTNDTCTSSLVQLFLRDVGKPIHTRHEAAVLQKRTQPIHERDERHVDFPKEINGHAVAVVWEEMHGW